MANKYTQAYSKVVCTGDYGLTGALSLKPGIGGGLPWLMRSPNGSASAELMSPNISVSQDLRTVTLEGGVVLGNIGRFDHAYAEQTFDG